MAINLIQGKQIATASWAENSISSSFATTSSYALTSSFAISASWAPFPDIDTGSLVTTSSFNEFTSSYYQDSSSFDTRINNLPISQLIREEFTWISGSSQTFQLLSTASQVYTVEVQGQGALSTSQYSILSSSIEILDQLQDNDYITVLYTNATTGFQPYYSQAQTDAIVGSKVTKTTTPSSVYGTDASGEQTTIPLNEIGKRTQLIHDCSGWQLNTSLTLVTVQAASSFSWNNNNQLKSSTPSNTTDAITLISDILTVPIGVVAYNSRLKKFTIEARYSYYRTEDRFVIGYFQKNDAVHHLNPTILFDNLVSYGNNQDGLYKVVEVNSEIDIPAGALLVYAIASNDPTAGTVTNRFYSLQTLIELEEI